MFRNYLKIAFRNQWKNKQLSAINIIGLAAGMACSLLIFLYVKDEISYDRFNKDSDRIYRVVKDFVNDDGSRLPDATTPPGLAPAMQKLIPEIEHVTRIYPGWGFKTLMHYEGKHFLEERVFRVDSSFFDVFSFPLAEGNAATLLSKPNSIVLTKSTAKKYFGNQEVIGKVIQSDELGNFTVTGVAQDPPENSHFHFDFLLSVRKFSGDIDQQWGWYNFYTYIKLRRNTNISSVNRKIKALYAKNVPKGKNIFYTQALTDIHLGSDLKWEIEPNSSRLYVVIFGIIASFVIVIACINYINLVTAKSAMRAKEIGIRKVSGAIKASLIKQFLIESVVTVLGAFLLALLISRLMLPSVNQLTDKNLSLSALANPTMIAGITSAILVVGLSAGLYPAIYLASFKPVQVLKGLAKGESRVFNLRKVLVVSQFAISIALIIGTLVVIQQINYIQNTNLGLNKDQVLIIGNAGNLSPAERDNLRTEMLEIPGVRQAATANGVVGGQNWTAMLRLKESQTSQLVNFIGVSYKYLDVLGIHIREGRNFSPEFPSDTLGLGTRGETERIAGGIILNEKAIKDLGIGEPAAGRLIAWTSNQDTTWYLRIVGVTDNFHFTSFKNEIKPFGFVVNRDWQDNFTLKVSPANIRSTLASLEQSWKKFMPDRPFQYSFLDETFANQYRSEQRFNAVFLYITSVAIIIACLGLFGLTAFMVERRTREIGIRKVVGSSVTSIMRLLSTDFLVLVAVAFALACPAAWYFMSKWLQNFAYRVHINWWLFPLAGALAIFIALVTISFQTLNAAVANPVKSLRTDG